jgi:hypothetical protein
MMDRNGQLSMLLGAVLGILLVIGVLLIAIGLTS